MLCSSRARWTRSEEHSFLALWSNNVSASRNSATNVPPQPQQHNIHCRQTKMKWDNSAGIRSTHTSGIGRTGSQETKKTAAVVTQLPLTNNERSLKLCFFMDSVIEQEINGLLVSSSAPGMKMLLSSHDNLDSAPENKSYEFWPSYKASTVNNE